MYHPVHKGGARFERDGGAPGRARAKPRSTSYCSADVTAYTKRKAACVATSGPSLGRKRPRRAAIAKRALPHTLAKMIAIAAQLNVGKRRVSKGVTGTIRRFTTLALKADHFRKGSSTDLT